LTLRNSILIALGITACVGTPDDGGDASNSGSDGSSTASSGSTTIVASTAAPGSGTAPESGTSTSSTAGEVSESDASSAGESSSTTGSGGCEPIPQRGTDMPSGFEACDDGRIVRVDAAAGAPSGQADYTVDPNCAESGPATGSSHEDCTEGVGICTGSGSYESPCACRYSCETDADCSGNSICMCALDIEFGGSMGRCIPADCSTNADCEDGFACAMARFDAGC